MAAIGEEEQFQKLYHFCLHNFLILKHSGIKSISRIKSGSTVGS